MADYNTYSDMIHLFIDGEATEVERNTLFNALKDSPELQEEFSSAMRLKQAFAADIMQLQPPTYLQSQIAERAGILVAASATAANAPVITSAISNAVSNVAPVATGILSKGVLTALVGASIGVLSTVGIIKLTSNNTKTTPPAVPQTITRQAASAHTLPALVLPTQIAPMEIAKSSIVDGRSSMVNSGTAKERTEVRSTEVNYNKISSNEVNSNEVADNGMDLNPSKGQTENRSNQSAAFGMISGVPASYPTVKAIGDEGVKHNPLSSGTLPDMGPSFGGRFSARLGGIITSQLYQGRNDITLPVWNNLEAGLKYDLDASNAIGIEAGQEKFPLYLANGNGGYDDYKFITWVGISYTYMAVYLDLPLNIHPELRAVAAESSAGPIVKGSFGLVLPVTPRLSFSLDGEETMLPIRNNGANLIGTKLAATGSMIFHF